MTTSIQDITRQLSQTKDLCSDVRFGQMLAMIGELVNDSTGKTLWEVEDEDFAAAIERLHDDLSRRTSTQVA